MSDNVQSEKKITINEFLMWLNGVEEMQAPDWTPTADQWKRIRGKINTIVPASPPQQEPQNNYPYYPQAAPQPMSVMPAVPAGPSGLQIPPVNYPPPAPSFMPDSGSLPGINGGSSLLGHGDMGGKVKTPDIDTSRAPYSSSFA